MSNLGSDVNKQSKEEAKSDDLEISVALSEVSSVGGNASKSKSSRRISSSSERQFKFERAQKCLENAALVTKKIKEHRKATAELLGRPFEDDDSADISIDSSSIVSARTDRSQYASTPQLSVAEALNIPGISESLANSLKQKEILMEKIKHYKAIQQERNTKKSGHRRSISNVDTSSPDYKQVDQPSYREEAQIQVLQVKIKSMETTIMELQERLSEKESLLEAKKKASSLLSDNMSKKEKDALILLEDTRQQMTKMQENFLSMEHEWKQEKAKLISEIENKNDKLAHLEEANSILENERFELSLSESKLREELLAKQDEIAQLESQIAQLSRDYPPIQLEDQKDDGEEKGTLEIQSMNKLTKKIELLEQINLSIRQTNLELETQLASISSESKPSSSPKKQLPSPQLSRKRGKSASRSSAAKLKSPWSQISGTATDDSKQGKAVQASSDEISQFEVMLQTINKKLLEKELLVSQQEEEINTLKAIMATKEAELKKLREQENRDTVIKGEFAVVSGGISPGKQSLPAEITDSMTDLEKQLLLAQEQISSLTFELETANKNMVKVKSAHKTQVKQLQKTVESFSKISDANSEVVRLSAEVNHLQQKVIELEEDKGNLQLHLVDYDSGRFSDSDLQRKLSELENIAETRLRAISDLETQKFDLVQELHAVQKNNAEMEDKLADFSQLQSEQVSTEIKTVQLEEQVEQLSSTNNSLLSKITELENLNFTLESSISALNKAKGELSIKLEHYIQENIYLTDKVEKISAEKVSSAESIEIVESLTSQEKMEMEEFDKAVASKSEKVEKSLPQQDENEDLLKIQLDRNDLIKKIELFTQERHEVMSKMEYLKNENDDLKHKIEDLSATTKDFELKMQNLLSEKERLLALNQELHQESDRLQLEFNNIVQEKANLIKQASSELTESAKDVPDSAMTESSTQEGEEKLLEEKPASKTKTVKQVTKEILKLKNTIKEREAEIADCQMKVLSLEEQIQKQDEILQRTVSSEKALLEEKYKLELLLNETKGQSPCDVSNINALNDQIHQLNAINNNLTENFEKIQKEYQQAVHVRDSKIQELEKVVFEGEQTLATYNEALIQKDNDIANYLNQINQLNSVAQKLKSTIEILEEEKAKEQNGELIKNLNSQIIMLQNVISENDAKINKYEDERSQVNSKIKSRERELLLAESKLVDYENVIKDLQDVKLRDEEEIITFKEKCKEKDEEIHEIKLQLRKESIEYDSLRKSISDIEGLKVSYINQIKDLTDKLLTSETKNNEFNDILTKLETKNKELMDKLKKYAVNLKKKANMCIDLENEVSNLKKELGEKRYQDDNSTCDSDSMKILHAQISSLQQELAILTAEKQRLSDSEKKAEEIFEKYSQASKELQHFHDENERLNKELEKSKTDLEKSKNDENHLLFELNKIRSSLALYEAQKGNYEVAASKITCLERELCNRDIQIVDLQTNLDNLQEERINMTFGHEAKLQERDLIIESLQTEISGYKQRIERLEESVSAMEERRRSLERKADVLGDQLYEKQKAYSEYINNEDQLINRLGMLMEHDQVVEKQLQVIEKENLELQMKNEKLTEENESVKREILQLHTLNNELSDKIGNLQKYEFEVLNAKQTIEFLEPQLKKVTSDLERKNKQHESEITAIEHEFHNQIDEAVKEKKALFEKCEKLTDNQTELERRIDEYAYKMDQLSKDYDHLKLEKAALEEAFVNKTQDPKSAVDVDAYILEINRLQAELNQLRIERIPQYEHSIHDLNLKLNNMNDELVNKTFIIQQNENSMCEIKSRNDNLFQTLAEKDAAILQLNKSINEMAFVAPPEAYSEPKHLSQYFAGSETTDVFDMSALQSQIFTPEHIKQEENFLNLPTIKEKRSPEVNVTRETKNKEVVEKVIVPKKAYECYPSAEPEIDPFNSDDGWGLGGDQSEDIKHDSEVTSLKEKLRVLAKENEVLKAELSSVNLKLVKAIKKLKEMKAANESLTNEIKLNKQMSQFGSLDSAIEDELKKQVKDLEEKIKEYENLISKDKQEKESLVKQNDVLHKANDRYLEMKEKMDSELHLWKMKFKEANDKISSFEWGANSQAQLNPSPHERMSNDAAIIEQIEKENNEYSVLVEQLNSQISQLTKDKQALLMQISNLKEVNNKLEEKIQNSAVHDSEIIKNLESKVRHLSQDLSELSAKSDLTPEEKEDSQHQDSQIQFLDLQHKYEKSLQTVNELQTQLEAAKIEHSKTKSQLIQFEEKCAKLNLENDELLSNVADLRSSLSAAVDQRGCEVAEMWKQHLAQVEVDFHDREQELKHQLLASEQRYENMLDSMQSSSQEETSKMIITEQLSSLQQKLKDKEDHLLHLQNQYSEAVNQLSLLRSELDDEKLLLENKLLTQQEESERMLIEKENYYKNILSEKDSKIGDINLKLATAESSINNLLTEKENILQEFNHAQQNIENLKLLLTVKDTEIAQKNHDLNEELVQKNNEFESLRQQLLLCEKKVEEISYEKESELAIMRLQLHDTKTQLESSNNEIKKEKDEILEHLQTKIQECSNLNKTLVEFNKKMEESSKQMADMRLAMESQEIDIVTLRDELENYKLRVKHVSFSPDTKFNEQTSGQDISLEEQVPGAELDLALYMLHQRDVRCEELTVELTQLLEERDTLQLRLSDCLRIQEGLRQQCLQAGVVVEDSEEQSRIASPVDNIDVETRRESRHSDDGQLQTKLSQLRGVKQNRDVRLREDSEHRQRQMELLQRDVAHLPPEAAEQLRQAHHTITHDSQSTSTVLLNWLRGRTTPKVVHM